MKNKVLFYWWRRWSLFIQDFPLNFSGENSFDSFAWSFHCFIMEKCWILFRFVLMWSWLLYLIFFLNNKATCNFLVNHEDAQVSTIKGIYCSAYFSLLLDALRLTSEENSLDKVVSFRITCTNDIYTGTHIQWIKILINIQRSWKNFVRRIEILSIKYTRKGTSCETSVGGQVGLIPWLGMNSKTHLDFANFTSLIYSNNLESSLKGTVSW